MKLNNCSFLDPAVFKKFTEQSLGDELVTHTPSGNRAEPMGTLLTAISTVWVLHPII
jgi:hypothetical protein